MVESMVYIRIQVFSWLSTYKELSDIKSIKIDSNRFFTRNLSQIDD